MIKEYGDEHQYQRDKMVTSPRRSEETPSQLFAVSRTSEKKIIMEVYGEGGVKVADYVDKGDKGKLPYYQLTERRVLE